MNLSTNKVSICKQDVCVNVYGELAKAFALALIFAAVAYGASQLIRALK